MIWDLIVTFLCTLFGRFGDGACREARYKDADYTICSYQTAKVEVRLFLNDGEGKPYGRFSRLPDGAPVLMLMNGGMYHDDLSAVGLYVENGIEQKQVSTKGC